MGEGEGGGGEDYIVEEVGKVKSGVIVVGNKMDEGGDGGGVGGNEVWVMVDGVIWFDWGWGKVWVWMEVKWREGEGGDEGGYED